MAVVGHVPVGHRHVKGWKASTDDGAGTYVELDLGSDMVVAGRVRCADTERKHFFHTFIWMHSDGAHQHIYLAGVVTKGHSIEAAWIKTFTVSYKADGGSTYSSIDSTFTGNSDQNTEVENMFSATQSARYWWLGRTWRETVLVPRCVSQCWQSVFCGRRLVYNWTELAL